MCIRDRAKYVQVLAWISAMIIVGLNIKLVYGTLSDWFVSGMNPFKWIVLIFADVYKRQL